MPGRQFLLFSTILAITLLGGTSASAYTTPTMQVEHDWTITVFGGRFGYLQTIIVPWGNRMAFVYWGGGRIPLASGTGLRGMLPVVGIPLAAVALVVWRIRAKRRGAAP